MSHSEYLGLRRFERLDGLRALSILLVFTAHPVNKSFWPIFHGQAGVSLFFVLSGFLITTLLLREESRVGRVDFKAFYVRRLFRIYPMFLLVFLGYCILILVLGLQPYRRAAFVANIPYFLLFFPEHSIFFNTFPVEVPFNMAWSIGIEEKFYLVWPVLAFGLLVRAKRFRAPLLLAVVVCSTGLSLSSLAWSRAAVPYAPIALGSLGALMLHSSRTYAYAAVLGRRWVAAGVFACAVALQFGSPEIETGGRLYVVHGAVLACLVVAMVTSTHREYSWLSSRPMVYIGALSYVLYLIHNFGLNFAEQVVPHSELTPWTFLSTGLGIGLSIVAAHFIHRWFEEPLRRYGVALSRRGRAGHPAHAAVQPPVGEVPAAAPPTSSSAGGDPH